MFYKFIVAVIVLFLFMPQTALAYLGPGSGLSAIGSFLALLAGIIIAILGFLWYPVKRMIRKKKSLEPDQSKRKDG